MTKCIFAVDDPAHIRLWPKPVIGRKTLLLFLLWLVQLPRQFVLICIRAYQATAPIRPRMCRFEPSCSEYAAQSITKYGLFTGIAWGIRRILRCNPFSSGGYDPVP